MSSAVRERSPWQDKARCAGTDPRRWWHVTPEPWQQRLCAQCPVLVDCAADALRRPANGVIRAGIGCDRSNRWQAQNTRHRLLGILAAHGVTPGG